MPIRVLTPIDPNRTPGARPVFGRNALRVFATTVGVIFLIVLGLAFALAKTGAVTVPFFSMFYGGPKPVRVVHADPIDETAFRVLVGSRLMTQASEKTQLSYTVALSEAELTGALRGAIAQALRKATWKASGEQLAVEPEFLEFFGRFENDPVRVDLRMRFVPHVEDGKLRFDPVDIRFGDYPVHPSLAKQLAAFVFARDLGTWTMSLADIRLHAVALKPGSLELIASPPNAP